MRSNGRLGPIGTAKPGDFAMAADRTKPNYGVRCFVLREYDAETFEVQVMGSWLDTWTGVKEPPQIALGYRGCLAPFLPPGDGALTQESVEMWEGAV